MAQVFSSLGLSLSYLISQLVNFVLLAVLLYVLLYRPVLNFLHQRQERIARSMADADAARENAAKAQQDYDRRMAEAQQKAQEIIAQAVQAGEQRRAEIEAEAAKHAEEIRERAHADAEQERARILGEVQGQIASLSMMATERVLGGAVAPDRDLQHKLIDQFLSELGDGGKAVPGGSAAAKGVA
ncbi:MAG TPA: F0F1 ATP synthase subunit B [Anaerolineae bacterium]